MEYDDNVAIWRLGEPEPVGVEGEMKRYGHYGAAKKNQWSREELLM